MTEEQKEQGQTQDKPEETKEETKPEKNTEQPLEDEVRQADAETSAEPEKETGPEVIEQALEEAKTEGKLERIELPKIKPGMLVRVHQKIKERTAKGEEKERVKAFEAIVLGVRGSGNQKTFTVRKVSQGIGVEKIFPLATPSIEKVEVMKRYKVRRARLGFLKRGYKKRLRERTEAK